MEPESYAGSHFRRQKENKNKELRKNITMTWGNPDEEHNESAKNWSYEEDSSRDPSDIWFGENRWTQDEDIDAEWSSQHYTSQSLSDENKRQKTNCAEYAIIQKLNQIIKKRIGAERHLNPDLLPKGEFLEALLEDDEESFKLWKNDNMVRQVTRTEDGSYQRRERALKRLIQEASDAAKNLKTT